MTHYDIIIVGAGAVGCAVARELARYDLRIGVLEKEADVGAENSGRNSAVAHAGFNYPPGSLKAKLCVEGSKGFEAACDELDVPYKKTGKLVVAFDDDDVAILKKLLVQGLENGVEGLSYIDQSELNKLEPHVGGKGALLSAETAIFDPFRYVIALAENAQTNGVEFHLNTKVSAIKKIADGWEVATEKIADGWEVATEKAADGWEVATEKAADGREVATAKTDKREVATANASQRNCVFTCTYLINSAGLYSDVVSKMAGYDEYTVYPCRGEYTILDKASAERLKTPVYPAPKPGAAGLGVHLTPTIDGNLILGPSAEYVGSKTAHSTTKPVMDQLLIEAKALLPPLQKEHVIGHFDGIRPKLTPPGVSDFHDFVIRDEGDGLIQLVGIESPGLTASLPIARMICSMIRSAFNSVSDEAINRELNERPGFNPRRTGTPRFRTLSPAEQNALIAKDPEYGEVFCRCECVTKKEIREAIENPLGVRSISGIKRRARATMGRCNGGYCLPRIASLMVEEYGMRPEEICLRGAGSYLFSGFVK